MSEERLPILAIVYTDGFSADKFIATLGYSLRSDGVTVAGLVQVNTFVEGRPKCDMAVEELLSGTVLQLSEYRGVEARGCRLDQDMLTRGAALLIEVLREKPELLILNKFGKIEAEGRGLRDALAEAVASDVPLIVGVPYRNLDQWRVFANGMALECQVGSPEIDQWLLMHGIGVERPTAAIQLETRL